MTIIILEGPDGSGKDTTLEALRMFRPDVVPFERACTSDGGPVDNLSGWVEDKIPALKKYRTPFGPHTVLNRHPLISELVYGPIIRGSMSPCFDDPTWLYTRVRGLVDLDPVVVWHLPPTSTIESYLDTPGRVDMPGVGANIYALHAAYRVMAGIWPARRMLIHDYTRDPNHTRLLPLLDIEAPTRKVHI